MKKVLIVYGPNYRGLFAELVSNLEIENIHAIVVTGSYADVLSDVLSAIRKEGGDYRDMIVIYSGQRTGLLDNNLPCDKINFDLLVDKLTSVVGIRETTQQKALLRKMLTGALIELTKAD